MIDYASCCHIQISNSDSSLIAVGLIAVEFACHVTYICLSAVLVTAEMAKIGHFVGINLASNSFVGKTTMGYCTIQSIENIRVYCKVRCIC